MRFCPRCPAPPRGPDWGAARAEICSIVGLHRVALRPGGRRQINDLFAYGSPAPDVAALAAQYAFAIACNQVFLDGNKRTAWVICRTFLLVNGHDLQASQEEKYTVMMQLSTRQIDAAALAEWIRARLVPRSANPST